MITAVADVNPTVTGNEIRSTSAPNFKNDINICTIPERKHSKIAKCGPDSPPSEVCRLVINANKAVGPIVNSRHPPNTAYKIHPINPEYKPY